MTVNPSAPPAANRLQGALATTIPQLAAAEDLKGPANPDAARAAVRTRTISTHQPLVPTARPPSAGRGAASPAAGRANARRRPLSSTLSQPKSAFACTPSVGGSLVVYSEHGDLIHNLTGELADSIGRDLPRGIVTRCGDLIGNMPVWAILARLNGPDAQGDRIILRRNGELQWSTAAKQASHAEGDVLQTFDREGR